jgi:hypothetical protein
MTNCGFCGILGHNIRSCNHERVGYLLLRMRCKTETSYRLNNWHILYNWLSTRNVKELRMLLANKYTTKLKNSKHELVDLLFELESKEDNEENPITIDNPYERELITFNIIELDQGYTQENLDGYGIDALFAIFLDCLETKRKTPKFQIMVDVTKCDGNSDNCDNECSICYENMDKTTRIKYNCNHEFCYDCSIKHIKSKKSVPECALCRTPVHKIECSLEKYELLKNIELIF